MQETNMNAMLEQAIEEDGTFLRLVDFKWLMACLVGRRIDLSRLQRDIDYARECVQLGLASNSNLLRQRSVELLALLVPPRAL
jgi:hypothetical protein